MVLGLAVALGTGVALAQEQSQTTTSSTTTTTEATPGVVAVVPDGHHQRAKDARAQKDQYKAAKADAKAETSKKVRKAKEANARAALETDKAADPTR
jgi:hypothetical protein